jgi:hypothetical protein
VSEFVLSEEVIADMIHTVTAAMNGDTYGAAVILLAAAASLCNSHEEFVQANRDAFNALPKDRPINEAFKRRKPH